ncbi:outer membrane protein assembly factor BamB family protein [Granulicella arctica]|uniref:outer membrane protein assembly factor BamB family protein n=1 Tax=Granulicella arctica TaxID=940613 RepID=UPI0021DFF783|nr:PQQ-binding-like beta-propeller repeat protein [Granulicella arctica]
MTRASLHQSSKHPQLQTSPSGSFACSFRSLSFVALATLLGAASWTQAAVAQSHDGDRGSGHQYEEDADDAHAWRTWGGNISNTHGSTSESEISASSVGKLTMKWAFTTAGDVSATPTIEGHSLYVPDWGGFLYRINTETGKAMWSHKISDYTDNAASVSRTSPAIARDRLVFGDQGGATVIAVDKTNGSLLWRKTVDTATGATITGSPVVYKDRVYVGVSSNQESLAETVPDFDLTFRGSILCLDLFTGKVIWQTYTIPEGYTGGAVWGGNFVVDPKRDSVYVSTGNNYSIPDAADKCVSSSTSAVGKLACLDPKDLIDAVVSLDLETGRVKWSRRLEGVDTWTVSCVVNPHAGIPCPDNAGPDYDFGSAPNFFTTKEHGRTMDVVGAGQKSGMYWGLNPDNGDVLWGTQVGPGGSLGGIEWGSAADGARVYVALNDSNRTPYLLGPQKKTSWSAGSWAALDGATGEILWQVPVSGQNPLKPTLAAGATGQVSVANGVMFAGSLSGDMVALDAASGQTLWKFASGGSVVDGPSIVDGTVYWGSGYAHIGVGKGNNQLFAFSIEERRGHGGR